MKINYILLFIACFAINTLIAQQVKIEKKKSRIGDENVVGFASKLTGNEDDIESKWYRAIRSLGRMREEGNYLTVKEANFMGWGEKVVPVYSKLTAEDATTQVWVTISDDEMPEDSLDLANEQLEQFLYDFSLTYYRDLAQEKVEEAERAVAFTEKKHRKLEAEGLELQKDLEDNSNELTRLQQLLEKNELEQKVITQQIVDNKANQDTTLIDIERLKAVVEQKKRLKEGIE